MIDETNATPVAERGPEPVPAPVTTSHPASGPLAEIETVLRDLESVPAHITEWLKSKLAEVRSHL